MNTNYKPEEISIPLFIIFTIITCGLFNLYWNYKQMEVCNRFLGRGEFNFFLWLLLSLITCGIYHFFYQYKMGSVITNIQAAKGARVFENLPVISVVVSIFGGSLIVDIIHQYELNKFSY
jgi:hypothetical protein